MMHLVAVGLLQVRRRLLVLRLLLHDHRRPQQRDHLSEQGVRLAQKMLVGPCIPVGPISGRTWRLSQADLS